ncbi:hypothetical protein DPMN_017989 [Dreissena polymorpha]|uniref:Uncharacterized protein n=1 Tax=Dreissena polymorpha TaxID=45954 RepID=A0A9D4S8Q2_DREPO|nr:hypothetical protein DPMN_017989 [Dreissena polymorpha]
MVLISTSLRCPYVKRLLRLLPQYSRSYYDATQSYGHEDLSTMLPRCLYDNGVSSTLFLRLYTDSRWPRFFYACFEHVQNKRGESVQLSNHDDSIAIILRF